MPEWDKLLERICSLMNQYCVYLLSRNDATAAR